MKERMEEQKKDLTESAYFMLYEGKITNLFLPYITIDIPDSKWQLITTNLSKIIRELVRNKQRPVA